MIFNKSKQLSVSAFIILLLSIVLFTPATADETHRDPSLNQKTYVHRGNNLILESINEDNFLINGKNYLYTNQTRLFRYNHSQKTLMSHKIITPCLVNLVYKQYTETTEAVPFPPGTMIIEKLTVIKEIDPATLESYKTKYRQKTN